MDADDVRAMMPPAPPPHPERRSAALGAALARYDETQRDIRSRPNGARSLRGWWTKLFAPQYAALATIAVVVLISLPRLDTTDRAANVATPTVAPGTATRDEDAVVTTDVAPTLPAMTDNERPAAPASVPQVPDAAAPPSGVGALPPASAPTARSLAPQPQDRADTAAVAPPPPPPPPSPSPPPPPPPPPAPVAAAGAAPAPIPGFADGRAAAVDDAAEQIVVSGQRRRASAAPPRGAWSACTLDDPQQALARCRGQIDLGAKGVPGRAAASLADGLSLGWSGDWAGAVGKFDAAIDLTPRSALAHLNRALARQRRGDVAGAAADFDLAVRYGRSDARTYYFRGRFRREQGDARGAAQDERRAGEVDDRRASPD